jgi:hypothetical protein
MKTKNNQISYSELFQSFYKLDTFTKKTSITKLILANVLFLFLVFIITFIGSALNYQYQSMSDTFTTIFIGTPIFLLIIFSFMYLYLSSYDKLKKTFNESFLTFSFITLGFIFIGNTLNLIKTHSENNFILIITSTLLFLTVFYYIFNITQNMKNYFNISWQRMFLTQIITYLILSLSIVTYWINILITTLK